MPARPLSGVARTALVRLAPLLPLVASSACQGARTPGAVYAPRSREVVITTVPLLSKELQGTYPFLREDFGHSGMLAGQEIYAFVPSTITVILGDTVRFQFINPEDDAHGFVLPDFAVSLPGQAVTRATYVARRAGIFTFTCSIAAHLPSMRGQLIVLSPTSVRGSSP